MRLICAFILFTFFSLHCFAQKENNNWYFGENAGITFNNGRPVALTGSAMHTNEGTISVSDSAGTLLFYSDGRTVWNRSHEPMLNGTGLLGHFSASQSVLAVPKPGSQTIYYIFTVDGAENNLQNGLCYSILDMNLNNGLGGITDTKNVLLEVPVTEKLIAVRHSNEKDFWILAHKWNSNEFVAYKLTDSGVINSAVVSNSGSVHGGDIINSLGTMKANGQGTKLAIAIVYSNILELCDFDATTGKVSNAQTSDNISIFPYGLEFSGDGSKLYVTGRSLFQFNLAEPDGFKTFFRFPQGTFGALQIGPDKKIYHSHLGRLSVINNPDAIGIACNYDSIGVNLAGRVCHFGLPNMFLAPRRSLIIPNIITPNNDKLNDAFILKNVDPTGFMLQLFNRWGSLIYKTESYKNDWDASGNSAGLYYYLLRNSETGQTYKGWLEVVK